MKTLMHSVKQLFVRLSGLDRLSLQLVKLTLFILISISAIISHQYPGKKPAKHPVAIDLSVADAKSGVHHPAFADAER
jgi:hypothetical protein